MPRPKLDGDVTKINFKSNVYYGPLEVPALDDDMKSKKMSPKEKAAYVEKLLEDFDRKMDMREDQMKKDLDKAIQKFEFLLQQQLQQLPTSVWDMPYEEFLKRGQCVHEVILSLETDWQRKGQEEETKEREVVPTTAKIEQKVKSRTKQTLAPSTKGKKRRKRNPVTETPVVIMEDDPGNGGITPFITFESRKPETTPKVGRLQTRACRKLVPRPSRHGYSTRSSVRSAVLAKNSPGLIAKKDELSTHLSRMLDMVKLAPDREALQAIQQSIKSIVTH